MNHSSTPIANSGASKEAQPFSVKRAQVEFHNFASLGEPERNLRIYADENMRRGAVIRNHRAFIGEMTPFLEMGANAGHSSYMLCNEFGAQGFALDLSADSLRHGRALMDAWSLERAPVRIAGDAANLPFTDGSLRFVCAFQMLSQFMDVESVFREVARVLAPGGVFLFAEEPLRRKLSAAPVSLPVLRHDEALGTPPARLGPARLPGAGRDRRASGGKLRHSPEP